MKIKNIIKYALLCIFFSKVILFSSVSFSSENICDNETMNYLIENDPRNTEYNETRNDAGIHFDFDWNREIVIIKRNKNNYPIVRYSLFDNKNFEESKTAIIKINDQDLSKISDEDLIKLTYFRGNNNYQLDNGKTISISSKPYKFNNFKLEDFKILSIQNIDTNIGILEMSFISYFTNVRKDLLKTLKGTEFFTDQLIPICQEARYKNNWPLETVEFEEFKYDADVREGLKNKEVLVNPVFQITIDDDLLRTLRTEKGVGFFRQSFDFKKFPFDTQKLIIRIKTGVKNHTNRNFENGSNIGTLTLISPEAGVFKNLENFIKPEVNKLKAWKIPNDGISVKSKVLQSDEWNIYNQEVETVEENVLDIEVIIQRNFEHYVWKIMLPVFLILCVAWYVLWIPTEKYEARLNTSIIALLALIAYNFVFQDDIPRLEYLTDMDWFILLSYIFCCIPVFLSIAFSKFISKNQVKVMRINRNIKIWGAVIYFLLTAQIFYNN